MRESETLQLFPRKDSPLNSSCTNVHVERNKHRPQIIAAAINEYTAVRNHEQTANVQWL